MDKNKLFDIAHHNLLSKMNEIYAYAKIEKESSCRAGFGLVGKAKTKFGALDSGKDGQVYTKVHIQKVEGISPAENMEVSKIYINSEFNNEELFKNLNWYHWEGEAYDRYDLFELPYDWTCTLYRDHNDANNGVYTLNLGDCNLVFNFNNHEVEHGITCFINQGDNWIQKPMNDDVINKYFYNSNFLDYEYPGIIFNYNAGNPDLSELFSINEPFTRSNVQNGAEWRSLPSSSSDDSQNSTEQESDEF